MNDNPKPDHGKSKNHHREEHEKAHHLSKEVFRKEDDPEQLKNIKGLESALSDVHDRNPPRGKHVQNNLRLAALGQPKKNGEGGKYTWGGDKEAIKIGLEEMEYGSGPIAFDKNDPLAPDMGEEQPAPARG